jgi:pimeloyl-ACP methyl ester carboxylesterase
MFSSQDEDLLAQPLPELRQVPVASPGYAGGRGLIEYREAGAAGQPVVLLMHGIGSSSAGYRAQLTGLRDRYRVVAWNAPGFGASTPLADARPESGQYVDAALALLTELGVEQLACSVGSSWGSVVAADFARIAGLPIGALVLSAPNVARGFDQPADQREAARQAALKAGLASFGQDRQAIADKLLALDAAASVRAHTVRLRDAVTPAGWQQAMNVMFGIYTPKTLSEVKTPLTLVVGREDKVAPEALHAGVLLQARPDADYHRLEGVGHMPKLEAPSVFNELVHRSTAMSSRLSRGEL